MAKKTEYEYRASYRKDDYKKVNGRFKKVGSRIWDNIIANASYWKGEKRLDDSFGAKSTMSHGTTYTSHGAEDLMHTYTAISPDGKTKSVRTKIYGSETRTNKLVDWK